MNENPSFQVKCPTCGTLTIYSTENKARPFCSSRCRMIDLGGWAAEKYRFALSPNREENENSEDISNLPIDDQ